MNSVVGELKRFHITCKIEMLSVLSHWAEIVRREDKTVN